MSYRKPTLISILLAGVAGVYAQAPSQEGMEAFKNTAREQFEQFKAATQREFEDFRRKANEDYARFMHEAWKPRDVSAPEPAPVLPLSGRAPLSPGFPCLRLVRGHVFFWETCAVHLQSMPFQEKFFRRHLSFLARLCPFWRRSPFVRHQVNVTLFHSISYNRLA